MIKIDEEFKNLIPPLSIAEFNQLEENILRDGIQDPLKVWNGILIDGHNRYQIAQKHNLPFNVTELNFKDRAEVVEWIIKNQFGRRNVSAYDRICLALKLKPIIAEQADERMKKGTADPVPNLAQGKTIDKIAEIAGVGRETVRKVEKILEISKCGLLDDILAKLKRNEISISFAYESAISQKEIFDSLKDEINIIRDLARKLEQDEIILKKLYEELKRRENEVPADELAEYNQLKSACEKVLKWRLIKL